MTRSHFVYNLPLQVWPKDEENPDSVEEVLNYMPRRQSTCMSPLNDMLEDGETREEYLLAAADHLENLARLFRKAAIDPKLTVYYHDEGMDGGKDK